LNDAAVALAYRHCEAITRLRARNFYYGIRLLPPRKRAAMCALYAMARRIDDIGDDLYAPAEAVGTDGSAAPAAPDTRLAALGEVRASLALLREPSAGRRPAAVPPGDPVLTALADASRAFPLSVAALSELVEGCEWDITGRDYHTFEELVEYCRRVAGTIGRLSLSIYGSSDDTAAEPMADALGVALQLTNILRDLIEDRDTMGRVYLPRDDLERFGVGPALEGKPDDLMALICFETGRAAEWYERGLPLLGLLDKRSRACTAAMAGIYRRLLDKIRGRPDSVLDGRISLSAGEKTTVAALALARALA
jgi:phytoene synthase